MQRTHNRTTSLTFAALMTALAIILSYFPEIPLAFFAPWLKLDFSFTPLLLLGFSIGPGMMAIALLITNLVHIIGGTTSGVGELANMLIGLAFLLPPTLLYRRKKTRQRAAGHGHRGGADDVHRRARQPLYPAARLLRPGL